LPRSGGLPEDVEEVIGRPWGRQIGQRRRQLAFEAIDRRHANRPSGTGVVTGAGAPTVLRSTPSDRWSRDFAVPSGIPMEAATSGSGIPRK
jgi:hypothetical protein